MSNKQYYLVPYCCCCYNSGATTEQTTRQQTEWEGDWLVNSGLHRRDTPTTTTTTRKHVHLHPLYYTFSRYCNTEKVAIYTTYTRVSQSLPPLHVPMNIFPACFPLPHSLDLWNPGYLKLFLGRSVQLKDFFLNIHKYLTGQEKILLIIFILRKRTKRKRWTNHQRMFLISCIVCKYSK